LLPLQQERADQEHIQRHRGRRQAPLGSQVAGIPGQQLPGDRRGACRHRDRSRAQLERVTRRAGRTPRAVTADRGYGQPAVEHDLQELGVRTVAIPRQATTSAARKTIEHSRGFHRLVKWRTGSEGRISYLKRGYGWDRTRLDGKKGAAIWCGHGVLAHNLVKISVLAA
jgi:transposase, IS5 family